jgi:glycine betaine/proline transport system ATP-binding protein
MAKIRIRNIYKIFGDRAAEGLKLVQQGVSKADVLARAGCVVGLDDVSLDIEAGRIFVVMGLSGSGKSTLVRHINRLVEPTSGAIFYDGRDVLGLSAGELRQFRRRHVSMVFQSFGLMPHRTVLQNAAYGLLVRDEPKEIAYETARRWIEMVGLQGYEGRYPWALSGGMRQRVGLARALAAGTDVILMDEPFSALDPLIRAEMQDQLLDLQRSLGKTIVFITHDLDEALRLGTEIAILRDGRLVQVGTPQEILERPANDYVARFVERRPRRPATTEPPCPRPTHLPSSLTAR